MDPAPILDPQRELPPPPKKGAHMVILIALLIILLGAGFYYYWRFMRPSAVSPVEQGNSEVNSNVEVAAATDLGSSIYAQSNNPLSGKLPEPVTTPNPADGFYKNPFQQ